MYGLVNQAVKDLVVSKFGNEMWAQIATECGLGSEDFLSLQYYPDALTYSLVASASKHLNVAAPDILHEFGKHWVLFTAAEGYGPMMDLFGSNFKECLTNLNNLHARMGMSMPNLTPPKFNFTEISPTVYEIGYESKRAGLSPMVSGLLYGLAEKYGVKIKIEMQPQDQIHGVIKFRINLVA